MAEYIERAELMKFPIRIDHYDKEHGNVNFVYGVETVLEYAENIPAAEVVPVVHGRWINRTKSVKGLWDYRFDCSACGHIFWNAAIQNFNYCPNCGARMDGE